MKRKYMTDLKYYHFQVFKNSLVSPKIPCYQKLMVFFLCYLKKFLCNSIIILIFVVLFWKILFKPMRIENKCKIKMHVSPVPCKKKKKVCLTYIW